MTIAGAAAGAEAFDPDRMRTDHVLLHRDSSTITDIADIDGDGTDEIFAVGTMSWRVLALDAADERWVTHVAHPLLSRPTDDHFLPTWEYVALGDVDFDSQLEVVTVRNDGVVATADAWTATSEATFFLDLGALSSQAYGLGDVDPEPGLELLLASSTELQVHRLTDGALLWTSPIAAGVRRGPIHVAQVDADPAREIVFLQGTSGYEVIDSATRSVQQREPETYGGGSLGDVDGDGIAELITCLAGECVARDLDVGSDQWRVPLSAGDLAPSLVDVDSVGRLEIFVGDGIVLDGLTGAPIDRALPWPAFDTGGLLAGDVDGDCRLEAVGIGLSGLTDIVEMEDGRLRRRVRWAPPLQSGFAVADVDGDGVTELLTQDRGALLHRLARQPYGRHSLPNIAPGTASGLSFEGASFAAGQLDEDPALEWVVREDEGMSVVDGATGRREVRLEAFPPARHAHLVAVGDLDGDGIAEVVTSDLDEDVLETDHFWINDARSGALTYLSPELPSAVRELYVVDVEGDGQPEIVFSDTSAVRIWDGATRVEKWFHRPGGGFSGFGVGELFDEPGLELMLGAEDGSVTILSGTPPHPELAALALGGGDVRELAAADLDGDGVSELIVLVEDLIGIHRIAVADPVSGEVEWRSQQFEAWGGFGRFEQLGIADADDDANLEILVTTPRGIRIFEYDRGVVSPPPLMGVVEARPSAATCCPAVELSWEPAEHLAVPVTYEVHRSETTDFEPDETTLVGATRALAYRDHGLDAGIALTYAVVARGARGLTATSDRLTLTPTIPVPPPPPDQVDVVDPEPCEQSGVEVHVVPPIPPAGARYDLHLHGELVATDFVSPVLLTIGDAASHEIEVRATRRHCELHSATLATGRDAGRVEPPRITSVVDEAPCEAGSLRIAFAPSVEPEVVRHDLVVDGAVHATDVTSPVSVVAPTAGTHSWLVRAVTEECGAVDSVATDAMDGGRTPMPATNVSLSDPDPCAESVVTLDFDHPGFVVAGHHELWRDGGLFLSPVTRGQELFVGGGAEHSYVLRTVDDTCGGWVESDVARFTDRDDCTGLVGGIDLRLEAGAAGDVEAAWARPWGDAVSYDIHVGTLEALTTEGYDHLPEVPGVTFPDAPDPTRGCRVTAVGSEMTVIRGLTRGQYVLVVGVSSTGALGPWGSDSDGVDRADPAIEPRDVGSLCP